VKILIFVNSFDEIPAQALNIFGNEGKFKAAGGVVRFFVIIASPKFGDQFLRFK